MDINKTSQYISEEIVTILKRGTIEISDKTMIIKAIKQTKNAIYSIPTSTLEEDLMCYLMPCIKNLFVEIYQENSYNNSSEQLIENLEVCIMLTDFIGNIIEMVSTHQDAEFILFRSIISESSNCFHLTYKHCKESQEKYQNLTGECKAIKELYKKNQDIYLQFLSILNILELQGNTVAVEILIQALESILNIIKIVFGINIKALADSWKAYCNILEKHSSILLTKKSGCILEIEYLIEQIQGFMNIALENEDEKQRLHSIKFTGFLLKVALKIINEFWGQLQFQYLQDIQRFLCSVYNFSLDTLGKWNLKIETQNCIQNYLFGVITPFVCEKILCEDFLKQYFLNIQEGVKSPAGCVMFDLKILKYLLTLPRNSIHYVPFDDFLNHIFKDVQIYFPELYNHQVKTGNSLFDILCVTISECIIHHSEFYNPTLEQNFMENILGNDIWCHFLASETWIRVLSLASDETKNEVTLGFMELIDELKIDLTYNSHKISFLKRFLQMLFNILSEEDFRFTLEKYPPQHFLHVWRLVGFRKISVNQTTYLDTMLDSFIIKTKSIETINSSNDMIEILETLSLISTIDLSILDTKYELLIDCILKFWTFKCEGVNLNNAFLKFFISKLCYATTGCIKFFSNDQIITILQNMKELMKFPYFKLLMCELLKGISSRPIELDTLQNKLNSLKSDIFAMLMADKNEIVKEISLEIFQQFAFNDYHIVVNNVSRMLPHLNLEQYLRERNNEIYLTDCIKALEIIHLEHKCVHYVSGEVQSLIAKKNSFVMDTLPPLSQEYPKEHAQNNFNRTTSNKRIKLIENFDDDDTVDEILERIKSEIKCLTKILSKEKLSTKNAQKIKMLAGQLQNSICQN